MDRKVLQNMRLKGEGMENDGQYWSNDDRMKLEQFFYDGVDIGEIASELKRSEPAVVQQLLNMHCFKHEVKSRNSYTKRCTDKRCDLTPNSKECNERRGV